MIRTTKQIDMIITDSGIAPKTQKALEKEGVKIIIA
jgi:DeoR/GlpR family transcriptional regulator of sugar metabolism